MYIKQVIIQGFKSYRDQIIVEPFDPGHNVVVGRNGSGKSNFFSAIRFVLSDAYTNLGREERQALLHEGAGPSVMSAFVEILFDNSDNRFPTGKNEVVLRRTIGLQKDEYSLDRKAVNKTDVMNLLESAGFSRSNPYYIVPQGRVTALTHAKDQERLSLLKEVAGVRVFESKHQESLKIMKDTENKRSKIDELIKYIEERLNELDSEKNELKKFQIADKKHRCLEYALYHQEQKAIIDELIGMDERRDKTLKNDLEFQKKFNDDEEKLIQYEQDIRNLKQDQEILNGENKQSEAELEALYKTKAQIEVAIDDLKRNQDNDLAIGKLKNDLDRVQNEIRIAHQRKLDIIPDLNIYNDSFKQIQGELELNEQEYQYLYSKKIRGPQFRNKAERDSWLNTEIKSCEDSLTVEKQNCDKFDKEINDLDKDVSDSLKEKDKTDKRLEEQKKEIDHLNKEMKDCKLILEKKSNERKEKWKEEAKNDAALNNIKEELKKVERVFSGTMDQNTSIGLEAIKRIVKEKEIKGVYGPLYELFKVDKDYRVATEITAGQRLFHVVVDSEQTASLLIEEMNKKKLGRVTFMPLKRLRQRTYDYSPAVNALPLIDELVFDKKFTAAFQHVFGNTIVCESLEVASSYAKDYRFDTITLDGDRIDGRGAFVGGFYDTRVSRLTFIFELDRLNKEHEEIKNISLKIKQELRDLDVEVTESLSRIQSIDSKKKGIIKLREPMFSEMSSKQHYISYLTESLFKKKTIKESIWNNSLKLESKIRSLKDELQSSFATTLTQEENSRLQQLEAKTKELRDELAKVSESKSKLEEEVFSLDNKLHSNLERRRIDLIMQIEKYMNVVDGNRNQLIESKDQELCNINDNIMELNDSLARNKREIDQIIEKIEDFNSKITVLRNGHVAASRKFEEKQKEFEQYISKKSLLIQKRETCAKNIRELGVLPEEAFTKYINTNPKEIMGLLQEGNKELKKYSNVNKKAAEQFNKFNEQKIQLDQRKLELDESKESIYQLIEHLETMKDEALQRTFKQVSKNFSTIFEKLIPSGYGKLIMQRNANLPENQGRETRSQRDTPKVEIYVGVTIKVSFNSKTDDEGLRMQQLSGGQKALVALALIFAIQQCDPAPFYLFDEIDANLDAVHRASVASMIHELSNKAQFITTTFRPELLTNANKFYGVTFDDKVSRISTVEKEEALKFIEKEDK